MSLRIESLGWKIEITWRGMTLLPIKGASRPQFAWATKREKASKRKVNERIAVV